MDLPAFLSGDCSVASPAIKEFVQKFSQKFNLSEIEKLKWIELWTGTFRYLDKDEPDIQLDCLSTLRILSRDKTQLDEILTEKQISTLLQLANIDPTITGSCAGGSGKDSVVIESLKCLCNLVFNSSSCQNIFDKLNGADGIMKRVRSYKDSPVKFEIQFFDMKLLFLITALNTTTRARVRDDLNGTVYLTELIDAIVQDKTSELPIWFEDREIDLLCEILKVLFNLTSIADEEANDNELQFCRVSGVLRTTLLRTKTTNREKRQDLRSNIINLLSGLPNSSLQELAPIVPALEVERNSSPDMSVEFEDHDLTVLHVLIDFLRVQLENVSAAVVPSSERLGPILTVLIKCSRSHRIMRRYLRSVILPPLTDVMTRPEEGGELRNILCRLLTSPNTQIRDLVAELLFIICKEKVARMGKHTGYGNSMGMFANKGLLGKRLVTPSQEYSSDSEDSDTDEYKKMEHGINPVIGCYEPPHPNPFENMTEEQKEYEAMKLVNLIDQLDRQGIIKPARIAADGKPKAVDHILQLQDKDDDESP